MTDDSVPRVEDYMSRTFYSIHRDATVHEAISLLKQHDVNALIVDRNDADDEIGLVTVADVAREVIGMHKPPDRTYVFEIMTKPIVSLPSRMKVAYATRLLASLDLSQAVVTNELRDPIGIVNRRDLIFACLDD